MTSPWPATCAGPDGKSCAAAIPVSTGLTTFDNTDAHPDFPAGFSLTCGTSSIGVFRSAIWFSFVPSATGTYKVETCGSGLDSVLAVSPACNLTPYWCNDDSFVSNSVVTQQLQQGTTYYIVVGGFNTSDKWANGKLTITRL